MGRPAKANQWQQALDLLAEMRRKDLEVNVIAYTAVIDACAKDGNSKEEALALLAEMRREGMEPEVITYAMVLNALREHPKEARAYWLEAFELELFAKPSAPTPRLWTFDLHDHSEGSAVAAVREGERARVSRATSVP